ncbi:MAG: hypothetical protein A3G33_10345 [Omnitrophica bacterium RIFCSPLOWO2_12_FULL_44_17]|uniref:Glycosyltransferase RgtA/B/C/D-like domain-containing protein n=1 Tax=Candidatus Danuiimicrobium aquiferis TaxID=1801832 RepID=A0A1G1L1S4_9BACT|nr:MAG: hypothetical protein A3B72_01620 [Omnitrophica bacterium RIFCSPHIGHO2_02_FULL_45_28]OGW90454.1 MAG: hypothetical protein A3E74_03555 [Omnitrophica bacterium RIFCSPHIGHO2_12_FULL_44_12]OGW98839.1 MAG: hypothetical protein A3G33_10345 [Omnitrophica bacterium RIFCSPLOWO2_12_FULL_44_17]OGX02800.1 MAG: hypothetical protein A3J12_02465 [Omnitrophica bacterium RIFCSPLOWO2_02_FULL_44_11]
MRFSNKNKYLIIIALALGTFLVIIQRFQWVTDYPFSLYWSEGNRLYDYSIYFMADKYIANSRPVLPWFSPGRYLTWGILFLLPNTTIWLHRMWTAILGTIPAFLFGYILSVRLRFPGLTKWIFILWTFLFLSQGPIYCPLIFSACLIVGFVHERHVVRSMAITMLAGYYAGISRWIWFMAPGIWSFLVLCFETQRNSGEKNFTRINAAKIGIPLAGFAGGFIAFLQVLFSSTGTIQLHQSEPLLWYRLFPNATYFFGILPGFALTVVPLIAIVGWIFRKTYFPLNKPEQLILGFVLLCFSMLGMIVSVKIGCGADLHHFDMAFITFAMIAGYGAKEFIDWQPALVQKLPEWICIMGILAILIPVSYAVTRFHRVQVPSFKDAKNAIELIQGKIEQAQVQGEVLLMDERQLLTFGYLKNVKLVTDYEKKYLMEKAMGNNGKVFQTFYSDLAKHRFSLILSEQLSTRIKGRRRRVGEENNAWVKWVAVPLLRYYEPIWTYPNRGVGLSLQLLAPRNKSFKNKE